MAVWQAPVEGFAGQQTPAECRHGVTVAGSRGARERLNRLRVAARRIKGVSQREVALTHDGMLLVRTCSRLEKRPGTFAPGRPCSYCCGR